MNVKNMQSSSRREVPNQFIITNASITLKTDENHTGHFTGTMFQSYRSNIAFIPHEGKIFLDSYYWNYSKTTGKYRNIFLNETKKETEAKIKSGEYILTDLN